MKKTAVHLRTGTKIYERVERERKENHLAH